MYSHQDKSDNNAKKIRVLIVEDSPLICKILTKILNMDDSIDVVGIANDGKKAIEYTMSLKPDLITMDINLPIMNGFEATKKIMAYVPTPILIVSSSLYTVEMNLEIELVPRTSWWNNLRKSVHKSDWDRIRKKIYSDYNHRCGICGDSSRMNCHEIWSYHDEKHIQRLDGFIALCNMCHHVKHIGLAGILANQGRLDYDKVVEHFMRVNDCSQNDFLTHRAEAFQIWEERSQHKWDIDLGNFQYLKPSFKR